MEKTAKLTPDYLRSLFDYNPDTGKFLWRERPLSHFVSKRGCSTWNAHHAGAEAFITKSSNGYLMASVDKRRIKAHRAAWAIHHNELTDQIIDHINGDPLDNRITNLRLASPADNSRNQRIRRDNKTGLKGVYFHRAAGKYGAQIAVNGKPKHLGLFDTPEAAHESYCKAAKEMHGAFANDGERPL